MIDLRRIVFLIFASLITLLLAACDVGEKSGPASRDAGDWPSRLSSPIPGATFSLAEKHLPGTAREYRAGTHQGFDFFNGLSGKPLAENEPIVAVADGKVVRIDHDYQAPDNKNLLYYTEISADVGAVGDHALDALRGRQVWIRHATGHVSRYAHLSEVNSGLAPGDSVEQGQPIGRMGKSGLPSIEGQPDPAPHLHFELWSPDGSVYLGQDRAPLEVHRLVARHFGAQALPRYAQEVLAKAEAGETVPESYPPQELPETRFNVDAPSAITAGNAFSIPVTWERDDFTHEDFFALIEGQPLGVIDAGNGAWILGAMPPGVEVDGLSLVVGAADRYGQTLIGSQEIQLVGTSGALAPVEVPREVFELYSQENIEYEGRILGEAMLQSLRIKKALWEIPFSAPVNGDVTRRFGQQIYHSMLRPVQPLPGVNAAAESGSPVVAANTGRVALVEDLPIRGKTVALVHGGGVVSVYAHLAESAVQVGDSIAGGGQIGTAGPTPTGPADGSTVRWEMYTAGIPSDPMTWIGQILPGRSDS